MSSRSSSSTPQSRFKHWKSRRASRSRLASSARIAGSSRSRAFELQRQAFGKVAGEHAGRIEGLAVDQDPLDLGRADPEPLGDFGHVGAQIAGLVETVGQFAGDQPGCRVGKSEGDLLADMVAQRDGAPPPCPRGRSPSGIAARAGSRPTSIAPQGRGQAAATCRDRPERCSPATRRACRKSPRTSRGRPPRTSRRRARLPPWPSGPGRPAASSCGSARSSSGLRSISSSTKRSSSTCVSCSSLIDCISCGVITSDCDWRSCSLAVSAMCRRLAPAKTASPDRVRHDGATSE